jgi:murein tripeptide amidase MpaA
MVHVELRGYLAAAALALAAAYLWHGSHHVTRVAIRVDCNVALACERAEAAALDVWSEERGPGLPLDVVVPDGALANLYAYQVIVPDIDAAAAGERARLHAAAPADWFAEYHDYRAITTHLHELAALAPERAKVEPIGTSVDSRTIYAIHIGSHGTPTLVVGTEHAREWIAAATSTCIADRLVREYDTDPKIRDFVDHHDLWLVPVVNPDGYQYTWAGDRYWRKNRRDGHGVDLNRNFSVAWGGAGSSGIKRSEIYRGAREFSEPESAAVRDLAKRTGTKLYLDFHAYGQLLLYPWGYSAAPTKDHALYGALGDRVASALFAPHQTRYRLIQAVELYPASGTAMDWMYGESGALAFTIELRPKGGSGFVLPPEQIKPTCDEGLAALIALGSTRESTAAR